LGHPIRHFAYPYGAYNQTSIDLAREAGYLTAVTTLPGDYQPAGSDFVLRRARDTLSLP
jgi:peptidoglycan/xylan/chitin deacetylase (PgdA/CDA1 family)